MYLAFMWHAIIVPQSASLIISATQWSSSNTKPRDLLSCNMVKHLLTTGISAPPYLGISKPRKTPNLNRFYKRKRKNWVHLIKKIEMICLAISQSQPGIFTFKNYEFQKIHTFYKRKKYPFYSTWLNFTPLVIIQTSKMNLYEKLHFRKIKTPAPQ